MPVGERATSLGIFCLWVRLLSAVNGTRVVEDDFGCVTGRLQATQKLQYWGQKQKNAVPPREMQNNASKRMEPELV